MKVLVVYESMFGNTAAVATAVAHGLAGGGREVELCDVAQAPSPKGFDLVVAGAPTHAFSLSRPSTRSDAIKQGAGHGSADVGLREWLAGLSAAAPHQRFATFDTRVGAVRRLPGSAAAKALRIGHRLGYTTIGRQSFLVSGTPGPLLNGELERAQVWGSRLVSSGHGSSLRDEELRWQSPTN